MQTKFAANLLSANVGVNLAQYIEEGQLWIQNSRGSFYAQFGWWSQVWTKYWKSSMGGTITEMSQLLHRTHCNVHIDPAANVRLTCMFWSPLDRTVLCSVHGWFNLICTDTMDTWTNMTVVHSVVFKQSVTRTLSLPIC